MAKRSVAEVVTGVAVLAVAAGFLVYAVGNTGRGSTSGTEIEAKFSNIGALANGADVKLAGVTVGRVLSTSVDPETYQAVVHFSVQPDIKLPTDTSAVISSGGLLGGASLTLGPGGAETMVKPGGTLTVTQRATHLEDAVLMGVDEVAMRQILSGLVDGLESPKRRR